jgi:tetratricopeptide (TPR) repeat protein
MAWSTLSGRGLGVMLAVVVLLLTLAIGGPHGPTQVAAVATLGLGVALAWRKERREAGDVLLPPLWWLGPVLLAWTVVQAVPLPRDLVVLLSPATDRHFAAMEAALGERLAFVPLSLATSSTLLVPLRLAVGWLAYLMAASATRVERRASLLPVLLSGVGVVLAATAVLHALAGATRILGVYQASVPLAWPPTTLVNPNHASALLWMTASLSLGLASEATGRWRLAHLAAFVAQALVAAVLPTVTGILLAPSLVLLLVVLRATRPPPGNPLVQLKSRLPWFSLAVAALLLMGLVLAFRDSIVREWSSSFSSNKLATAWQAIRLAFEYPLTGLGAGAFGWVFASRGPVTDRFFYSPENLVAQVLNDWGVVVGGAALVLVALRLVPLVARSARVTGTLGAAMALVSILAHDLVDFALQLPALGALAGALLGLAWAGPRAGQDDTPRPGAGVVRWAALASTVVGTLGAYAVGNVLVPNRDPAAWAPLSARSDGSSASLYRLAWASPLDGGAWLRESLRASREGRAADAGRLVEYAAAVSPNNVVALRLAALSARDRGDDARLLGHASQLATRNWNTQPTPGSVAVPEFVARLTASEPVLWRHPRAILQDRLDALVLYGRELERLEPGERRARIIALADDYADRIDFLDLAAGWTARDGPPDLYQQVLARMMAAAPDAPVTARRVALDYLGKGNTDTAARVLEAALRKQGRCDVELCSILFEIRLKAGDAAGAERLVDDLASPQAPPPLMARLRARVLLARGDDAGALRLLDLALPGAPGDAGLLGLKASILEGRGDFQQALQIYRRLARQKAGAGFVDSVRRLEALLARPPAD